MMGWNPGGEKQYGRRTAHKSTEERRWLAAALAADGPGGCGGADSVRARGDGRVLVRARRAARRFD